MIKKYDIRSSLGPLSTVRSMSGGNQQKQSLQERWIQIAPY